ncbi:hypothetical protein B0A49_03422 [Cryomyces minteri]|uniref:Pullulan synthetase n=1 Tax=Cryomyces minteri TaxID=331657 RepID=A0A4U0XCV1_9PEZI|nr:hypothetical protein B0A49_03422 [Cryomyces minteri]
MVQLTLPTLLLSLVAALPAIHALPAATAPAVDPSTPFYLVTTSDKHSASASSSLKDVSATSLFDPYYQPNYLLRLIGPGYGSLPTFTLTDGVLHSPSSGPHGLGSYVYNSTAVAAGTELQFLAAAEGPGSLTLKKGVLAVGGETDGWTICAGPLGQEVIEYKGTDLSCVPTYIQAVSTPPY